MNPSFRKVWDHGVARNQPLPEEAYTSAGRGVFFTLRAHTGRPFVENESLCGLVCELLGAMREEYGCWVGAYCLMPDHLHFVAGPLNDGTSVRRYVDRFKGRTTNASWTTGWQGRLWQPRSYDHVLRAAEAVPEVYRYILENPVRGGLVGDPADWPWSGVFDPPE